MGRVLRLVFDRLHVLRNRIVLGGATWDSRVDRDQVRGGAALLAFLMPVFVDATMDNPHEVRGRPSIRSWNRVARRPTRSPPRFRPRVAEGAARSRHGTLTATAPPLAGEPDRAARPSARSARVHARRASQFDPSRGRIPRSCNAGPANRRVFLHGITDGSLTMRYRSVPSWRASSPKARQATGRQGS